MTKWALQRLGHVVMPVLVAGMTFFILRIFSA
jgi:hypothetical protein